MSAFCIPTIPSCFWTPSCFLTLWSYFSHCWAGFIVKSWFESYYRATDCKAIFFFKPEVMVSYGISECFSPSTAKGRYWWLTSKLQYITTVIPGILFHFAMEPVRSQLSYLNLLFLRSWTRTTSTVITFRM